MRRIILSIAVLLIAAIGAQAITLDEIVSKNIEARGGLKAIKALRSMRSKGRISIVGMGLEMDITQLLKRDRKLRVETSFSGTTFVMGYDGKTAWMINPMMGTEPQVLGEGESLEMALQADFDGDLIDWKNKGNQAEFVGSGDVNGATAYKVRVTSANGNARLYFIDAISFLDLAVEAHSAQLGETVETIYTNYVEVAGVMLPHKMDTRSEGKTITSIAFLSIEPNVVIDDSQFTMTK